MQIVKKLRSMTCCYMASFATALGADLSWIYIRRRIFVKDGKLVTNFPSDMNMKRKKNKRPEE
jgi:hypothetical protein